LLLVIVFLAGCGTTAPAQTAAPAGNEQEAPEQAAPEQAAPEQAAPEEPAERSVVDMTGEAIVLPEKVERVFCDWASGITLIMTLGGTDKLVVAPEAFGKDTFAWAQILCPAINDVKKDDNPYTNIEEVLNLEPDLVVTNNLDNIPRYQEMGLVAIYVNYNSNESFKQSMLIVGEAMGADEYAAAVRYNELFDSNVALVEEHLAALTDAEKPGVYYMDGRFADPYHTVGSGEIQEDWITVAGGRLATAEEFTGRNLEITAEKFLTLDPDMILIGAQKQAEVYDLLMSDNVLAGLTAVQKGQVYRIPMGIFPWCRTGPEAILQPLWAAKLFHPDLMEDVDVEQAARDFYESFYGSTVEDDVLQGIMAGKLSPDAR
jgi:iron complex transport system substrate-binding protein